MVILGLGSNIGSRLTNLRLALKLLGEIPGLKVSEVSPVYESEPLLPENFQAEWQNYRYLNAAVRCAISCTPQDLLPQLKNIEYIIGRDRHPPRWAPRVIDVDILAWDGEVIKSDVLNIPQKDLCLRPFAILPLADVAPAWRYPVAGCEYSQVSAKGIVAKKWGKESQDPLLTHKILQRIDTAQLVGILNITPDSFSDGGKYLAINEAIAQADLMFKNGAEIIDIGAESTRPRPDAKLLSPVEEWQRLQPILESLSQHWKNSLFKPLISLDTRHAETASKAIELYNIDWVNDTAGLDDVNMQRIIANSSVKAVFMHNLGIPPQRQVTLAEDQDVMVQILAWANSRLEQFNKIGIKKEQLIFDPGIGFGKTAEQSLELIKRADELASLKLPILFGHSRKSFLNLFTSKKFSERDLETAIASCYLNSKKIDYLRVHDVEVNMRALTLAASLKD